MDTIKAASGGAELVLALQPRRTTTPSTKLLQFVNSQALARANTFCSDKRRQEFLWSRVLLGKLLQDEPQACLVETPPRSPRVEGCDCSVTTITHTKTWIGAGISSVGVGIDMEVMNPVRVSEQLFTRLFDRRHWDASHRKQYDFYCFFGMYEAAVKMNVPFYSCCDAPYVGHAADHSCPVQFFSDGETLLTVVSKEPVTVRMRLFDYDKTLDDLVELPENPFVPAAAPDCLS